MTTFRSKPMAALAQTVSVSYAPPIRPEDPAEVLRTGVVRPGFEGHLTVPVDETPLEAIAWVLDTMKRDEWRATRLNLVALERGLRGQGRMRRWMAG